MRELLWTEIFFWFVISWQAHQQSYWIWELGRSLHTVIERRAHLALANFQFAPPVLFPSFTTSGSKPWSLNYMLPLHHSRAKLTFIYILIPTWKWAQTETRLLYSYLNHKGEYLIPSLKTQTQVTLGAVQGRGGGAFTWSYAITPLSRFKIFQEHVFKWLLFKMSSGQHSRSSIHLKKIKTLIIKQIKKIYLHARSAKITLPLYNVILRFLVISNVRHGNPPRPYNYMAIFLNLFSHQL